MCVLRIEGRFMKTFFIPFVTWLSLKIQLLHVKSPTFHILKDMKLIQMKFERSQIH